MKKIPQNYPIYETSYGSDIPINQIYVHMFDRLPSCYKTNKKYSLGVIKLFTIGGYKIECELKSISRKNNKEHGDILFINKDISMMLLVKTINSGDDDSFCEIEFYYTTDNGPFENQFTFDLINDFEVVSKKRGINLIKSEMGHLDTEEYELNVPDIDINMNYGSEFLKIHETIVKRLNKQNDKGIILFHGDPGTGKTSYIKYLTKLIEDKEILFIPPSMAESLSEPSIIPFLMEHKNSILIIEDAEKVISDREFNGSSAGVSNILNLTDGILGDCLNIQIVATFNMKREKIDPALLRKGRLIAEHKFTPLSVENSNILLKNLGSSKTVEGPTSLADIYNIDEELFRVENNKKIGF